MLFLAAEKQNYAEEANFKKCVLGVHLKVLWVSQLWVLNGV